MTSRRHEIVDIQSLKGWLGSFLRRDELALEYRATTRIEQNEFMKVLI